LPEDFIEYLKKYDIKHFADISTDTKYQSEMSAVLAGCERKICDTIKGLDKGAYSPSTLDFWIAFWDCNRKYTCSTTEVELSKIYGIKFAEAIITMRALVRANIIDWSGYRGGKFPRFFYFHESKIPEDGRRGKVA